MRAAIATLAFHIATLSIPVGKVALVSGDEGPARAARFRGPQHITVDKADNVLIADTENHVIRLYSTTDDTIRRVVGTGPKGWTGLNGPATACSLNRPHGVVVHPKTGVLYISDSENNRILRIEN